MLLLKILIADMHHSKLYSVRKNSQRRWRVTRQRYAEVKSQYLTSQALVDNWIAKNPIDQWDQSNRYHHAFVGL